MLEISNKSRTPYLGLHGARPFSPYETSDILGSKRAYRVLIFGDRSGDQSAHAGPNDFREGRWGPLPRVPS
jgi:hypothetical protein